MKENTKTFKAQIFGLFLIGLTVLFAFILFLRPGGSGKPGNGAVGSLSVVVEEPPAYVDVSAPPAYEDVASASGEDASAKSDEDVSLKSAEVIESSKPDEIQDGIRESENINEPVDDSSATKITDQSNSNQNPESKGISIGKIFSGGFKWPFSGRDIKIQPSDNANPLTSSSILANLPTLVSPSTLDNSSTSTPEDSESSEGSLMLKEYSSSELNSSQPLIVPTV